MKSRIIISMLLTCALQNYVAYAATDVEVALLPLDKARVRLTVLQNELKNKPQDFATLKQVGIIMHQLNRADPKLDELNQASAHFDAALKIKNDDPVIMAWQGSLTTLRAKLESNTGKQTFYVKLGTKQLDAAIKKAPDNIMIRNVRGYNSLELPVFFKRARFAVEDFTRILDLCKSPQNSCSAADKQLYEKNLAAASKLARD